MNREGLTVDDYCNLYAWLHHITENKNMWLGLVFSQKVAEVLSSWAGTNLCRLTGINKMQTEPYACTNSDTKRCTAFGFRAVKKEA